MKANREVVMQRAREQFGDHLTELRKAAGLSQREVAERAHLSPSLLSQVETGRRNATGTLLKALSAEYEVPVEELHSTQLAAEAIAILAASGAKVTARLLPRLAAEVDIEVPEGNSRAKTWRAWGTATRGTQSKARPWAPVLDLPTATTRQRRDLRRAVSQEIDALTVRQLEKVQAYIEGLRDAEA